VGGIVDEEVKMSTERKDPVLIIREWALANGLSGLLSLIHGYKIYAPRGVAPEIQIVDAQAGRIVLQFRIEHAPSPYVQLTGEIDNKEPMQTVIQRCKECGSMDVSSRTTDYRGWKPDERGFFCPHCGHLWH
jgi:hypothetical protein